MCAILGLLGTEANSKLISFKNALNLLNHRGPDSEGVWKDKDILLGHRRLSILDLSKNGHQPMIDKKTGSVLIFNGEIYNYLELSAELKKLGHKLIGSSDTEVLLNSLLVWGVDVLSRLNGMWSLAFWSPQKKQLILSRDRFGVKPLYFRNHYDGLAFASEPKALLSLFPECKNINENALLDFLGNNTLYGNGQSFYRNIDVFPPAHYCIYDIKKKNLNFVRYWDYPKNVNDDLNETDAIEEFTNLFEDSVRLRLRSDVPTGVTLSGGLDSTSILAAVNKRDIKTSTCLTSIYNNSSVDEYKWAKCASDNANAYLLPVISEENEWLQTLKKITWHMDSPCYSPAVYPVWNIMKRSRLENILVLLDGQGADESLAGYPHYVINNFLDCLKGGRKLSVNNLINDIKTASSTFGLLLSISWLIREAFPVIHSWYKKNYGFQSVILSDVNIPSNNLNSKNKITSVRDRLIKDHSTNILPGLLHYSDSISMAHGIELRNPFLDYRLVEWIFRLPNRLLFNNNQTKWLARRYLRENNQNEISNRKDKKGYPTPLREWMVNSTNNQVESILLSKKNPLFQWCDKKKIEKLIHQNKKGIIGTDHHLFKLLSSQTWIQTCLYE